MSFATDKYLPSGTYSIINAQLTRRISFNEQDECFNTSDDKYAVSLSDYQHRPDPDLFSDMYSGPSQCSPTRNGQFKAHRMCSPILLQGHEKETTSLQRKVR